MTLLNYMFGYREDRVGLVGLIVPETLFVRLNPGITDVSAFAGEPVVPGVSAGWQHQWLSPAAGSTDVTFGLVRRPWGDDTTQWLQRNGPAATSCSAGQTRAYRTV